jgi:hypothetical protein
MAVEEEKDQEENRVLDYKKFPVPSLGLLLSNIVSFFNPTDDCSFLVIGLTALVSFILYSSYLGPTARLVRMTHYHHPPSI